MGERGIHRLKVRLRGDEVGLGDDEIVDAPLVEHLDRPQGELSGLLDWLEAVGHSTEADHLAGLELRRYQLADFLDVGRRRQLGVPKAAEGQQGTGVAVPAVVLASAPVGVQPDGVLAEVAFVPFYGVEE